MRLASTATAVSLTGVAALHLSWGAGSVFPFEDRATLADTVAGTKVPPGPRECFAVGGLLLCAAGAVADLLPIGSRFRRGAVSAIAVVLGGRGVLGVAGRTGSIVAWTPSPRFDELDKRYYGPVCLLLASGAALSLR